MERLKSYVSYLKATLRQAQGDNVVMVSLSW